MQKKEPLPQPAPARPRSPRPPTPLASSFANLELEMEREGVDIAPRGVCFACNKSIVGKVSDTLDHRNLLYEAYLHAILFLLGGDSSRSHLPSGTLCLCTL